MDRNALVEKLQTLVGAQRVCTDDATISESSKDYIGFRRYERAALEAGENGAENRVPKAICVVRPQNTEQVSSVLALLSENKVAVVPRTGGSSVTMGIEPTEGGVIVDGSDMNEILTLNETDMMVTVRCGTPLELLENYLNARGYTTGHFPQSLPLAQVGGLIATRSIGQFSTLYGGIEDMLVGLEAVLAGGEVVRIKNNPRRSVGPDLRHLFLGSEGMLGFITEATLKIFKYQPEGRWMNAYGVKGMRNGLAMLRQIMAEGYRPAVARLHDDVEVERDFSGMLPEGEGYCLLLFLADGPASVNAATGARIAEIAAEFGTLDLGKKPLEHWLVHRNDVCQTLDEPIYYDAGAVADTCEISAHWSVIADIYDAILARIPNDVPTISTFGGHSSHSYLNGTNIYFSFGAAVVDGPQSAQPVYMSIIRAIMEETLKRGGSIAHHHGSGKYRTEWMPQEHGTSYPLMYKLKDALDPNHILNRGVILV